MEAEIEQSFPHGFITTKLFPASFCELGIERFRDELLALPDSVRDAVVLSLRARVEEYGRCDTNDSDADARIAVSVH
jgi:hypothetical protein